MSNPAPVKHKTSVKETLISIAIAFAMAFVFRGFVIEAFLIPTGSMAPTLLGQHLRYTGRYTGYSWTSDTRDKHRVTNEPFPVQGSANNPIAVHDPMSGELEEFRTPLSTSWGDRIFVMKYLYSVYDPQRWDIVVFKNPNDPDVNYIKRLIGLPGEQLALIDGDVFYRIAEPISDLKSIKPDPDPTHNAWALPGWKIARKPERAQRAMWQDVFNSEYTPLTELKNTDHFDPPWQGVGQGDDGKAWKIDHRKDYEYTGPDPTSLVWTIRRDGKRVFYTITDAYAYNELNQHPPAEFNVSDIRLAAGVRPAAGGLAVMPTIATRAHEFRARITGAEAVLEMRPTGGDWTELGRGALKHPLTAGKVTNLEFWHTDQSLSLFCEGDLVVKAEYDWTPEQRVRFTTGLSLDQAWELSSMAEAGTPVPTVRWDFSGGAFTLYRVALSRDIYYQPGTYRGRLDGSAHSLQGLPSRASHPKWSPGLTPDQFFLCGDNSPASFDARLWDFPSPWVAEIDPTMGVVHRDLIIGKAFWVYFPAPFKKQGIPVPDFGEMRFIW